MLNAHGQEFNFRLLNLIQYIPAKKIVTSNRKYFCTIYVKIPITEIFLFGPIIFNSTC